MESWAYPGRSINDIYGPVTGGQAVSERASISPGSLSGSALDPRKFLSVPALLVLGVLTWLAIRSYD
jgi:hypothetical protein